MMWSELKEEAKKMGAEIMVDYQGVEFIRFRGVCFRKDGAVDSGFKYGDIAINRTPRPNARHNESTTIKKGEEKWICFKI